METVHDLAFLFVPGVFFLLFVSKRVFKAWSVFAVWYIIIGFVFLITQDAGLGMWNMGYRSLYTLYIGLFLSLITVLWVIIHILILRHAEKKSNQAVVK